MDRFIARENIKHFRDLLWTDLDARDRVRIQRLLIEEEDKLARNSELLETLERHIENGRRRITAQCALVERMQCDGHNGLAKAQALLDGMVESQFLHMNYHSRITVEIEQSTV
jgi:hypothetical protein